MGDATASSSSKTAELDAPLHALGFGIGIGIEEVSPSRLTGRLVVSHFRIPSSRVPSPSTSTSTMTALLTPQGSPLAPAVTQNQQHPEKPRAEEPTKDAVDIEKAAAAEEPKVAPAKWWRDLLRKQEASSTSSSATDTKELRRRGLKPLEQEPSLNL